jgi:hypothetical protein
VSRVQAQWIWQAGCRCVQSAYGQGSRNIAEAAGERSKAEERNQTLQALERRPIKFTATVLVERVDEDLIIGSRVSEERH